MIIAVLVVYLLVLLGIGLWGGRESADVKGYFVAGKKLPSWVIAFSSNATGESAWLLLGLTGMGYAVGAHALWIVLGEVLGVAVAWVFVARPFKEYTDRYESITVADYLTLRFRDRGHVLRLVSTVVILSMAVFYTAAQLTASGKAFESFLGIGYAGGVILGAGVILYYTTVGGLKAVAYSDLLQGVLMLGCLVALPVVGIGASGGWSAFAEGLAETDPALLSPMGSYGLTAEGIASAAGFAAIGLAFLGSPQLLTRFMAARSRHDIVPGGVVAVLCIIGFDLGAVLSGMAGRVLFPGLGDPETILPEMAAALFPAILTGVFLVVVLAAIMSTVDSLLILASSAVVRDVVEEIFRPDRTQRALSRYGKATTVVIGLLALGMALVEARVVFWFVLFAWSGIACAFTPVVLCSLFWKGTTRAGAVSGMIAGFAVTILWVVFAKESVYNLYEMLPGFFAGLAATVVVSLVTAPPAQAAAEFDEVWAFVGRPLAGPVPGDERPARAAASGRAE
ncbi:MAG: sodium/proline symporter [Gammaproteobacteria bacterium]|nr:sodium/proline symporter [Gammaproteobacteria bacterium]MDE0247730.1 sodium/proline symporter [Gammaproteobacteria bacterium]